MWHVGSAGRAPCGVTARLRYYKYVKGHSFGQHVDQSVRLIIRL